MDSLQQKFGGETEIITKKKTWLPLAGLGIMSLIGFGVVGYWWLQPASVPATEDVAPIPLTTEEVESYRASLPRTFNGADPVLEGSAPEELIVPTEQTSADPMIENFDENSTLGSSANDTVAPYVPPAEAVGVPVIVAMDSGATANNTSVMPNDTSYVEGDVTISDVTITQPDRNEKTPFSATGVVNGIDDNLQKVNVSSNGEVLELDASGGTIKTTDGRLIPLSALRTNDIVEISGQRYKDAPVVAEVTITLIGVQELIPAIDIGV
jgi:Cu/Ag efflux protein CusF